MTGGRGLYTAYKSTVLTDFRFFTIVQNLHTQFRRFIATCVFITNKQACLCSAAAGWVAATLISSVYLLFLLYFCVD